MGCWLADPDSPLYDGRTYVYWVYLGTHLESNMLPWFLLGSTKLLLWGSTFLLLVTWKRLTQQNYLFSFTRITKWSLFSFRKYNCWPYLFWLIDNIKQIATDCFHQTEKDKTDNETIQFLSEWHIRTNIIMLSPLLVACRVQCCRFLT